MKNIFHLIVCLFCFTLTSCSQEPTRYLDSLPKSIGWVNDFEGIFTEVEIHILDSIISAYEKETTVELCVITIPVEAVEKKDIETLCLKIANTWGIGKKEKNNGILIAISKGHKYLRINNGLGIEQILTDAQTKAIIDEAIIPKLKNGQYFEGTYDGINRIIKHLDNTQLD
jgi:uncharacterized protein